jgi:DNA-binding MarR family transcriptional regulator
MSLGPEALSTWRTFLETHSRLVKLLAAELEEQCGMPLSWYDALVQLNEAGGMLRMSELAERLLLSRSATTRFVDRLEMAGLIDRRIAEEDRRGMEVRLSDEGLKALRRAAPVHLAGVRRHFADGFTSEEHLLLEELLRRLPVNRSTHSPA